MSRTSDEFPADLTRTADLAKALSHPGRLRIVEVLAARARCVCGDIVSELPLAQSTVSQHLKELKRVGLVRGRIEGPSICYCLDPAVLAEAGRRLGRICSLMTGPDAEG